MPKAYPLAFNDPGVQDSMDAEVSEEYGSIRFGQWSQWTDKESGEVKTGCSGLPYRALWIRFRDDSDIEAFVNYLAYVASQAKRLRGKCGAGRRPTTLGFKTGWAQARDAAPATPATAKPAGKKF